MSLERIRTIIVDDHDELGRLVARRIAEVVRAKAAAGGRAVLGLATGSTPVGVYRELIRLHRRRGSTSRTWSPSTSTSTTRWTRASIHTYHRFMWENLFSPRQHPAGEHPHPARRPARATRSRRECRRYEEAIHAAGGIDLQLLGIGRTGHIGFNEPGSGAESRTRLVTLDRVTRQDAAADFFGEENVPREAITMGVATILEAREILILATGEHKAAIVRRAVEGEVDHEVAATFLQRHPNTTFYLDRAAAAALTREATPWLVGAGRVDARRSRSGRSSGCRTRRARRSSSSPSATTPSTSCRRSWRGTARPARSTASSSTRSAPRSGAARSCRATSG